MKSKCSKCGYESKDNKEKKGLAFCKVCYVFAPDDAEELDKFVDDKIDSKCLDSFRKYAVFPGQPQKKAMIKKASDGFAMSRAPFGYKFEDSKLVPAQNADEIIEIFEEFINEKKSLRKLAEKHKLSVNGLKKILRNFTYIGKIRFNNQIYTGKHKPIISTTLFNHVQNKLDKIEKRKSF